MALRDFWTNVRMGARLVVPKVIADEQCPDPGELERKLRSATLWLTPLAVEGFDPADFDFLSEDDINSLASQVEAFRRLTRNLDPAAAVPEKTVLEALPVFQAILQHLEFDRYGDEEAYRLGKLIDREIQRWRPKDLAELRFETGFDHTGDPADPDLGPSSATRPPPPTNGSLRPLNDCGISCKVPPAPLHRSDGLTSHSGL